jgi:transaldolase
MTATPLSALRAREVSVWLDTLSRELLEDGGFAALMAERGVTGATSNPTIFERAIRGSDRYDIQIADALATGRDDPAALFRELTVEDVTRAAALLAPSWEQSSGDDGYVSIQCNPELADDVDATVTDARDLWMRLAEPNVLIKVAATDAGIDAIEELTAGGVSVNVTLLFSQRRYLEAIDAFMRGLERRVDQGRSIRELRSVASFFVSRVDANADERLTPGSDLAGRVGIANARRAYVTFREQFSAPRWQRLAMRGAHPQRPLWASTAPKSPAYRDVEYLEQLALRGSILTVPEKTLHAYADHGDPARAEPLTRSSEEVLARFGADALDAIADELERAGVDAFRRSYQEALAHIRARVMLLRGGSQLGTAA